MFNRGTKVFISSILLSFILIPKIYAQNEIIISGTVEDSKTHETLIGVNIKLENKLIGTVTDSKGEFSFKTNSPTPFTLVFSMVGYKMFELVVTDSKTDLNVQLKQEVLLGQEVIISASRFKENIMESPVSVEKLDILDLKQTTSANFYDGLYNLKGVDMNVQSLTFRLPNTRGFNGNTNYRINQLIDGIDNTPPGLGFAAGNIFGLSPLDIESVELLVGASSALYGPGGLNGTLLMSSKNPFDYQGLSASLQTGIMHVNAPYRDNPAPMVDFNMRYAKVLNNKLAFKLSVGYLKAQDWNASDYRDKTDLNNPELNRETNPGYDGVNVYGDEVLFPVNLKDIAPNVAAGIADAQGILPDSPEYDDFIQGIVDRFPDQIVTRTGYEEKDVVDYNTENIRVKGAIHYRINNDLEAILEGGYGKGTSVYTAQNRFSLVNFNVFSGRAELKGQNFFLRAFGMKEGAGDTYDAGGGILRFNEKWKTSEDWYADYVQAFTQNFFIGNSEESSHQFARAVADNRDVNGNILIPGEVARPLPGSDEFNSIFSEVRNTSIDQGGAKVVDKSSLLHFEGMYNFQNLIQPVDLLVGASYRKYNINSEGTTFFDTPGNPILVDQIGAFAQLGKSLFKEAIKMTLAARYDKHEKFSSRITPRFSIVYSTGKEKLSHFRASWQTAFRFPATADQWLDLDVGFFRTLGGLPEVHQKYNFDTNPVYPLSDPNPLIGEPVLTDGPFVIPAFIPETVTSYELGYKGLHFHKMILIDAYVFQNTYDGFMAAQSLVQNPNTPEEKRYQTTISVEKPVNSYGWAVGLDFRMPKGYYFRSNVSYNSLEVPKDAPPGFQARFNTPDYRINFGIANREVAKNIGFNLNWRWQNDFVWESPFGVGNIPAYSTLDGQVSYKISKIKTYVKLGASNMLNKYYTTGFGNASVGGLYYITFTFDEVFN
ncbi:TonB-dependent receptor [Flexithrix dorotheae]|uniref:TonB-dependent receptor n=1 Tax=Flexithrix dorotheae TaxID=70993 RepID=UPI0003661DBB|nr:TonB-dependent receptor [Flexithrix dorotheae]